MGAVRILRDKGRNAKTIKMSDCKKGPTGQTKREMAKWSQSCRNGELSDSGRCSCRVRFVRSRCVVGLAGSANGNAESSPLKLFFESQMRARRLLFWVHFHRDP